MSTPQHLDALSSERRHSRMLRNLVFAALFLGAFTTWLAWRTPKQVNVHLLPSVTAGSRVEATDGESVVPPANVYSFAYYIWQQINRWAQDGSKDYGQQIFQVQNYVTPQCIAQLTGDMQARMKANELRFRTRTLSEIPGLGYATNRVVDNGNHTAWTVFLDMQVQETFRGEPVKDVFIRYPIRVVRFDVDRERNPWQLAIDCYGTNRPARLSDADLHTINPANRKPVLRAPELPSNVSPSALPEAVPMETPPAGAPPASAATGAAGAVNKTATTRP